MMKVTLLSYTPEPLKMAFTAIRTCYSPFGPHHIRNVQFDEYAAKNDDHIRLVKQIVNHGHTSTLEHIIFNFSIEGVSRSLLAQLTRHRVGFSYSVQSQRYVKMTENSKHGGFGIIYPPSVDTEQKKKEYDKIMSDIQIAYDNLISLGVAAEDARYVLPNAAETSLILSVNLRAFMDFYKKRNKNTHAQWEIQELAEKMKTTIIDNEKWIGSLFD